jgi:hypothetical protein
MCSQVFASFCIVARDGKLAPCFAEVGATIAITELTKGFRRRYEALPLLTDNVFRAPWPH